MKFGYISDIHGNYKNLHIALFHLKGIGCEIVCLGDIVSENSDENEQCIQLLRKLNIQAVKGQHDSTCAKCNSPDVSPPARDFLQTLPEMISHGDMLCVHDNPLDKARDGQGMWNNGSYIRSQLEADAVFSDFFGSSSDFRVIFIGHTHVPAVFTDKGQISMEYSEPIHLSAGHHYIINPGRIGGSQRGGDNNHTYLSFDQEKGQLEFYRVESEGMEFVRCHISDGDGLLHCPPQKHWFIPFQNGTRCAALAANPVAIEMVPPENPMMFHITEKLSVCGYSGIPSPQEFAAYGFQAQLQCTDGFDGWIADYCAIKCLPFEDCTAISPKILSMAFTWLRSHWEENHRILISCGAGESRSVSIAIGLLAMTEHMPFLRACRNVFSAIPNAYPHPKTLLSVASYCNAGLNFDQLREIYDRLLNQPPFPWQLYQLEEAFAERAIEDESIER